MCCEHFKTLTATFGLLGGPGKFCGFTKILAFFSFFRLKKVESSVLQHFNSFIDRNNMKRDFDLDGMYLVPCKKAKG